MDKRKIALAALWLSTQVVQAQPAAPPESGLVLTLAQCYELARARAPLARQLALSTEQVQNNQARVLAQNRRPQLALNGQASYQSEVTRLPLDVPGVSIPTLAKDQYRLTLDASQTLYDGGSTRRQLAVEALTGQVSSQQTEVGLYRVREQLTSLYFNVLLLDETSQLREALRTDLAQRRRTLAARRRHGAATGQDLARLDAELLGLDQQLQDLALNRAGLLRQLGELLGQPVDPATRLAVPAELPPPAPRPEPALYAQQKELLSSQQQLSDARRRPRLSVYGQAGYGRPTLDFLRNDFHGFGVAGLRLSWALSGYYTLRQDREALRLGQEAVAVQQAAFEQSQRLALAGQQTAMERYRAQLATDQQLIALREQIRATAAVQLDNGIIGPSDYISEANALTQARLSEQLHRLQLLQAQAEAQNTMGAPLPDPTLTR